MLSPLLRPGKFFAALLDRDYHEIIALTEEEVAGAETTGRRARVGGEAQQQKQVAYAALLRAFLYFVRYGARPAGVRDVDFARFRPVCERLVHKGQLKADALDCFKPKGDASG
jgi:hypothetical protein